MNESFGLDDEVVSGSGASFDFGMDDETVDAGGERPGFLGNALRGAGERAFTLAGNLMQFAGNAIEGGEQYLTELTGINPALVEGPNGLEFTMNADPAATDTGLNRGGELIGGVKMGYEPRYTWEQLKADPGLQNLAGFVGEQGVQSIPDMAAVLIPGGIAPYVGSRTQEIAEARTTNDGRTVENGQVAGADLAAAAPAAVASALLERVGAKGVTKVGGVTSASGLGKAVATAATKEGATEFAQENIEYAGESVGTKAGYDVMTGLDRGAAGLVAGAGLGGTVRAATGTAELAANKLKKPIPTNDPNGMSLDEAVSDDIPILTDAVYPASNLLPAPDSTLYGTADGQIIDGVEYQNLDLERGNAQREADLERLQEQSLGYPGGPGMYNPVQPRTNIVAGQEDGEQDQANPLDDVAHEAATSPLNDLPEPTEAQKEAGNYRKGHVKVQGLDISIENPAGSKRTGTAKDGTEWETEMAHHYGYVKRTTGADGDQVDVFLGGNPDSDKVFVVDQVNGDGGFDEHKVLIGFDSLEDADAGYHANYSEGWTGRGAITEISMAEFKDWLKNGDTKKPLAYSKSEPAQAAGPEPTPEPTVEDLRRRLENLKKQALLSGWKPEMIRERKRLSAAIYQGETGVAPAEGAVEDAVPEQNVLPKVSPKQGPNESHQGNRDIRLARLQDKGLDILSGAFFGEAESAASEAPAAEEKPAKTSTKKTSQKKSQAKWADDLGIAVGDRVTFEKDYYYAKGTMEVEGVYKNDASLVTPGTQSGTTLTAAQLRRAIESGVARVEKAEASKEALRRPGPGEEGYTLLDARNDLIDARNAVQGAVVDARAVDRVARLERLVSEMEERQANSVAPAQTKRSEPSTNTLVSDERAAELRKRLKDKLKNQLNSGIDPEIMAIGAELAVYHIERGARTFVAFAQNMASDLGTTVQKLKPYLRSWYNGARDMMEDMGGDVAGMESPDAVRAQLATIDHWREPAQNDTVDTVETDDASTPETQQLPERNQGADPEDAATGDGDRQPVDAGLAEEGAGADRGEPVPGSPEGAGSRRAQGVERAGQQSSGTPRDRRTVRTEPKPADSVDPATAETSTKPDLDSAADFDLQSEDIGKGGLTKKYRDNIATIRILKAMASENRPATPEERKQIARYVGWGALKGVFDKENKQWAKEFAELKDLLTDAEYKAARASTRNAHYTSKAVVSGIYDAIGRLGFTSGRVLEPSAGTGNFFGMMPAAMRKKSQLHGVELDPLTSQIAAALYPSAKIAQATGFQDFDIPAEYFDLAIGNPPFGEEPIVDDARSPYSGASIHNYFFAKSIDKLRPGGLLAMVVSHNFLDAKSDTTRRWIADRADLVSAVRLPRTAFKENAGTDVVTDILVFQKRESGAQPGSDAWVKSAQQTLTNPKTGEEFALGVNQYFLDNPGAVLGTPTAGGSMYRAGEYTVEPSGDLAEQLKGWVDGLPSGIFRPIERTHEAEAADVVVPDGVKVGSFFVGDGGSVQLRGPDAMGNRTATEWVPPSARAGERMKGMIGLRDALRTQMRLEKSQDATEAQIEAHRKELNRLYDDFQGKYGYLNDSTNRRIFLDDTESALLLALEFDYDKGVSKAVAEREDIEARPPSAVKADIFNRRVMFPPADNIKVSSAQDALIASLNYKGRLDLDYMAGLYSKDQAEIIKELGDLAFNDPLKGVVTADEYLSGDVKTKLAEAEAAAIDNPEFKRNVAALKKVIPADKRPSEIHAALGAIFVPPEIYAEFAKEITGAAHAVHYVRATGQWIVESRETPNASLNVGKWGIGKMPAAAILARTMAGQGVVVTQVVRNGDGSTTTLVLEKETEAAREKQAAIKAEWQRWLWSDPDRADRIATIYNEKMNRTVVRKYDGSHMTFPGMSPAIQLLPHQKNGVWRGLQSRQLLLDHVVGAGKTFEVVALFMEMRRLGIARKPLIAVPNHLTLQWRSEFSRLYPAANVLAATPDDFSKGSREKFFSKIITGDWDAVIVGHSSLKKIALPPDTEKAVLEEQITELAEAIEETKRARGDRNIIRDMEGIKARLEARMKQRLQALGDRDQVVTFDELGVDAVAVDELHEFKNLFYNSTMERVPGMGNPAGSDKAFDLFVKLQWMFNTFGDQAPVFGATGTPVSNSLVEMFNMQRFLQYPTLKREGLHVFDAWAKQFGSVESLYEVSPSGTGYRQSSRFAKFKNLPALMNHYLTFADVVTLDDLKAQEIARGKTFPVPKVATGRPVNVVAKRSPLVSSFMGVPELAVENGQVQFGFNVAGGDRVTIEKAKDGEHWDFKVLRPIEGADGERVITSGRAKTEEDARLSLVEAALSPQIKVDPDSILGKFGRLRELNKATKGKVNALSLTGLANKAGLDYRLIDPAAPDFAGSKINMAVDRMVATYKKWSADKGAQLVFCDLSVPLSARSGFGAKERRIYVRNESGDIAHKRGTLHTVEGYEELPFFLVKEGKEKTFAIYDAATGIRVHSGLPSKSTGIEWATQLLSNEAKRQRWIDARDAAGDIEQEAIDDYNNANEIDTEESEAISLSDIAGSSGAQGFSVYDDIKAKLIAKGIPEREIAFIHDFGTPAAKEKLFKAVNNGSIRFLLGSTPKMGAGTNVQKRLVGLHHIDAPWRPSDLEQREGRIIRRGNMLYERDPQGFEVEIFRYATEQTYDTRRWQILEHKARGIEQLRNYDGTLNEIDDIEGEAANAADMKAAASGDPLILEETQLRNEVRRLETLQASHADETQTLSRRARERLRVAEETGPKDLKRLRDLLAAAEKHPIKKDEFAGVEVDGKKYKDREDAVKAIKRAIDAVFKDAMEIHAGKSATFTYRGIEFSLDGVGGYIELGSPTGTMDTFAPLKQTPPSAAGFLTRFANYISRLQAHADEKVAEIERAKVEAVQFREEAGKPFAFADDLAAAREAHKKVQRRLIAKGPDIPAKQKALLDSALAAQKAALRDNGYSEALDEFLGGDSAKFQPGTGKPATGTTASKVERWVAPVVASWGDLAPKVRVVQSLADMPPDLLDAAGQVLETGEFKAVLSGNTVFIVADAVENRVDALKSLAHETRAHWGMQIKADGEYQAAIERINWASRNNKYLRGLRDQVLTELKPAQQTDERIAEEVLAKVAEDMETGRPVSEFVQRLANRVFSAIRGALRRFGFAVPWSTTELKALVLEHDMLLRSNEQRKPPREQGIDTPFFQPDGSTRESPEVIGKRFDDVLKQGGENLMQKARDWLASASVVDASKRGAPMALTLRQLADVGRRILPQIAQYDGVVKRIQTERNIMAERAATIAEDWQKWAGKNRKMADKLHVLMHKATIEQVDPSEPFVSMKDHLEARVKVITEQLRSISGQRMGSTKKLKNTDDGGRGAQLKRELFDEMKKLRSQIKAEPERERAYKRLKPQWDALSPEAKAMYTRVRDEYKARHEKFKRILVARIMKAEMTEKARKEMLARMRYEFETQELTGPYFPLTRFGRYWLESADENGERVFLTFESEAEQSRVAKNLEKAGYPVTTGHMLDNNREASGASLGFINDLVRLVEDSDLNDEKAAGVMDDIYQLYLQNLPDRSMRKNFIHRQGVKGYSENAIRSYAENMMKGAYQLARLSHVDSLSELMDSMKKEAKLGDNQKARLYNEMLVRHEWVMNPTHSSGAQLLTSLGFVYMLGASPAAAAINMAQLPAVAVPVLGSKFGFAKTAAALSKAATQFSWKSGRINPKRMTEGEQLAMQEWIDIGVVDQTRSHDLAGLAEGAGYKYSAGKEKAMRAVSFLFHRAEQFNREITALAAYRMGIEKGWPHGQAVKVAADLTWDAHFDYSNANRARFMQKGWQKVAFQFKNYSLHMTYYMLRNLWQMMRGATPKERREAFKQLGGTLGVTALMGGTSALPVVLPVFYAAVNAMLDDEDEPFDAETEFRVWLAEMIGKEATSYVLYGVGGAGLSGRISLDGLWIRDPNRDLEGTDAWAHYATQAAGPVLGGIGLNAVRATDDFAEGDYWAGTERILPKAIKDVMKAVRFHNEGVTNSAGVEIVSREDLKLTGVLLQGMGLADSGAMQQYAENASIKGYETRIKTRRSQLMTRYYMAVNDGDQEELREVAEEIARFNQKNWGARISQATLRRSMKARRRSARESENGIRLSRSMRYLRDELDYVE